MVKINYIESRTFIENAGTDSDNNFLIACDWDLLGIFYNLEPLRCSKISNYYFLGEI